MIVATKRQIENAYKLAHFLRNNEQVVEQVIYPGLEDDLSHSEAKKLFAEKGYGAIVTFCLRGDRSAAEKFIEQLKGKINVVPTLGDAHTITMPIAQVWGDKYPKEGFFRLSIGCKSYEKLKSEINNAIKVLLY